MVMGRYPPALSKSNRTVPGLETFVLLILAEWLLRDVRECKRTGLRHYSENRGSRRRFHCPRPCLNLMARRDAGTNHAPPRLFHSREKPQAVHPTASSQTACL